MLLEHQRQLIGAGAAAEVLEQGRVVAAEAGVAELRLHGVAARAAHRAIEAVERQKSRLSTPMILAMASRLFCAASNWLRSGVSTP